MLKSQFYKNLKHTARGNEMDLIFRKHDANFPNMFQSYHLSSVKHSLYFDSQICNKGIFYLCKAFHINLHCSIT